MKLLKASIDRFGKWTHTTFRFSEGSIYCFYGENESGKSTLQQFILYMLFGLPPKRRKMFIPKNQNNIAGSLTVYDEDEGTITVQRVDGKFTCYMENGEERDEVWWQEQLSRISKEVYTAVNAFSATDLEAIRSMDHAQVSDILFSIGLSGSTAIYEVEKQVADQLDGLYKRRGKNPAMNKQIEKVVQTAGELERHRSNEAAYAPLISKKEVAEKHIAEQQNKLQAIKKELIILDKTIQALPQIQKYQQQQKRLIQFPPSLSFPSEGEARHQQLKEKLLPKISEYNLLKAKHSEYTSKIELLYKDLLNDNTAEQAKSLLQEKPNYEHQLKTMEQQRAAYHQEKKQCDKIIHLLEWERDETKGTVLPFHLESTWDTLANDQDTIDRDQMGLEEDQHLLKEKRISLLRDEKEVREQLMPETEKKRAEERLTEDKLGQENTRQKKNYETWKNRQQIRLKKFIYLYATITVLSVMIGFIWDYPLLYGAALIAAIGGAIQYFYAGTQTAAIENMLFTEQTDNMLTPQEKNELEQLLEQEKTVVQQLSEIDHALRQNNLLQIQAEEQQQIMDKRLIQLDDRKDSERFTYAFLQGIDVGYWSELLKHIRKLQQVNQTVDEIEKEIVAVEADNAAIDARLMSFPYADNFNELEKLLESQTETRSTLGQYEKELDTTKDAMQEVGKHLELLEQEQTALFQAANVTDENAFYNMAEDYMEKEALQQETNNIKEQLYHLFSGEKAEELLASTLDSVQLESRKDQVEHTIKDIESAISTTHHQLGEIQAQVERLEGTDDASQLHFTYEMEKNTMNDQAKEWAVLKLVQAALEKAKHVYQEKHFSKVMTLTGDYFAHMTSERYDKVIPPQGNGLFQVEDSENIRYTVEELSQGTIDQLYVSLRFAIAKAMRDQFDLPLLIDDAFVHFDETRTTQTIHLLEHLSKEQQVIFFTCKADIAEQFKQVYSMEEANIIT